MHARVFLEWPRKNGRALADDLEQVMRTPGAPEQMNLPDPTPPWAAQHVWDMFWELSSARGSNGFGPTPITYEAIECWGRLTHTSLEVWEVNALRVMDAAFLAEVSKVGQK